MGGETDWWSVRCDWNGTTGWWNAEEQHLSGSNVVVVVVMVMSLYRWHPLQHDPTREPTSDDERSADTTTGCGRPPTSLSTWHRGGYGRWWAARTRGGTDSDTRNTRVKLCVPLFSHTCCTWLCLGRSEVRGATHSVSSHCQPHCQSHCPPNCWWEELISS